MTGRRFEWVAQAGDSTGTVIPLVITVFAILVALLGVAYVSRNQARRLREESGHAERVFGRIPRDRENEDIHLGARRRTRGVDTGIPEADGMAALSRTAMQEAEIYLQHHRIALNHHTAYQQASLWSGLLGFSVVVVGAVLTYFVGLDVGVVTAVAGAIPTVAGRLLFNQANTVGDRAAENLRGLEDSVRRFSALQSALATTAEIGDRQTRNRMYEVIGLHLLFPSEDLDTLLRNEVKAAENGEQN